MDIGAVRSVGLHLRWANKMFLMSTNITGTGHDSSHYHSSLEHHTRVSTRNQHYGSPSSVSCEMRVPASTACPSQR